jgi:hypothetical protein
VILAGRAVNDYMPRHVAELAKTIKDCPVVVDLKGVLKDSNNSTL